MPDEFSPELKVTVNGTELSDTEYDVLTEVKISLALHAANRIEMRFLDDGLTMLDSLPWKLGDEVKTEVSDSSGSTKPIASCELTSVTVEPGLGGQLEIVLAADDKRHRLMRGMNIRTFLDMKDSDIASKIAGEYGLTAKTKATTATHAYVLQAQSDGAFLTERCRAIGYHWWVDGKELHFQPIDKRTEEVELTWGDQLTSFRVAMASAESSKGTKVRSWDSAKQQSVKADKSPKADLAYAGSSAAIAKTLIEQGAKLSSNDRFAGTRPFPDTTNASNYAESLAKRAASTQLTARGETIGTPGVRAGVNVSIDGLGKLDGSYLVTAADHIFSAEYGYRTRFVCGSLDGDGIVDLLGAASAASRDPWPSGQLVIGVVTNIEGTGPAAVKVKYPTLSDKEESAWARIVSAGAGADRGLQLYPEVGDEVLVGFEHGDPNRPLIMGGLWSEKLTAPVDNKKVVKSKKIVSRTWKSRNGHSITFNDSDSAKENTIVIAHADGKTKIELTPDKVLITTPKETEFLADGDMTLKAKGNLKLEANNITVKAKSKASIEGMQVSAKGSTKAAIEAAQTEIKGSATLKLEGGGMTEVKGGMVKIN